MGARHPHRSRASSIPYYPRVERRIAAGADGVHIEVHNCPEEAKSDGQQALLPQQYAQLMEKMRQLAALFGRTIAPLPGDKP
jgi:3-deoxy-7-phosphoheptulonate synthase